MSQTSQTVRSGAELDVLSGGVATSDLIDGTEVLRGGTDRSGTVAAGGKQFVSSGGLALADTVAAGGTQTISSGGVASGASVFGAELVLPGGVTSGGTIQNGTVTFGVATETVSGRAVQTSVGSGGTLLVASGGRTTGSVVSAYGQETVQSGGSALLVSVGYGGTLAVQAGGTATSATISGVETVLGVDSASTVIGSQIVSAGGVATSGVVLGGQLTILAGGIASGTTVSALAVDSGGTAVSLRVASGGTLRLAGGSASGTVVAYGGILVVDSGVTTGTILGQSSAAGTPAAAQEAVVAGGSAVGTLVADFGLQLVSGGLTTGTVVGSGGTQLVLSGGALNDAVSAGGTVVDDAVLGFDQPSAGSVIAFSGTLTGSGSLVQYGPGILALAGNVGGFSGNVEIAGGTVELTSAGAAGAGSISFAADATGTLLVDGDAPANTISGFAAGDVIDLASLGVPADGITVSTTGDVATLFSDGAPVTFADGSVASLTIAGAGSALLAVESDGGSGTEIASLGSFGAAPNGGVVVEVTGNVDRTWTITEAAGASFTYTDGTYPTSDTGVAFVLPSDRPLQTIIQSGPGTLILPSYEESALFGGVVEIAGGTVETTAGAGAGVTIFTFVSGTTGTLLLTALDEAQSFDGFGTDYSPAQLPTIGAIAPGDVVDFGFIPYASALSLSVTAGSVAITSGGSTLELANTYPITLSQPTAISLSIDGASDDTYSLSDDGSGGTALTVTGYAPGYTPPASSSAPSSASASSVAGPPFGEGTVPDGGASYDIIGYANGDVGIDEVAGTTLSYTSAVLSAAELIQSGPGTLYLSNGTGGASAVVISGGTVELAVPTAANGAPIVFASGTSGTLVVDNQYMSGNIYTGNLGFPTDVISGFAPGDEIVLHPYVDNSAPIGLSVSGDIVTLTQNGSPLPVADIYNPFISSGVYSLDIDGASTMAFTLTDGSILSVACYARDTLILCDEGERPVQDLAIGDRVVTVSGTAKPIRWIGRRSYGGRFLAGRRELLPIVFRAGALGDGLPRRDLRVSPSHAMLLDGFLIPARHLVNGTTITQDVGMRDIEYVHIELLAHDAIWAEGAASETFIDDDSRGMFQNAAEYAARYPDARPTPAASHAPRLESGYELEAIRTRLARYAQFAQAGAA